MRSNYTVKNPHRDPNVSNEKHIDSSTEAFVVLDNLSIVTSLKWHTDKKFKHQKLFDGCKDQCTKFVELECSRQLELDVDRPCQCGSSQPWTLCSGSEDDFNYCG